MTVDRDGKNAELRVLFKLRVDFLFGMRMADRYCLRS